MDGDRARVDQGLTLQIRSLVGAKASVVKGIPIGVSAVAVPPDVDGR